jgi:predicted secreted protein
MSILKGTDLMVFVKVGTAFKSIAYATNHTLNLASTSASVSTKDSGGGVWDEAVVQKLNWTMSSENLYSNDGQGVVFDDLFALYANRTKVTVVFALEDDYLSPPTTVPTGGWTPIDSPRYEGTAYISSITVNAPNADNASLSVELQGIGALTQTV